MSPASEFVLEVEDVRKRFGERVVLDGVDLQVRRGEICALLGRNGCGKSTLLRCLNRLVPFDSGRIRLHGVVVADGGAIDRASEATLRRRIGMVFQQIHLFPHWDVLHNVMAGPLHVLHASREAARATAMTQLARVGLADRANADPATLSGGQQQRVAIARALAMAPDVLLFDEATSALDPVQTREVAEVVRTIAAEGVASLVVTHDVDLARDVATRVLFVDGGRIAADGPPHELLGPSAPPELRAFLDGASSAG